MNREKRITRLEDQLKVAHKIVEDMKMSVEELEKKLQTKEERFARLVKLTMGLNYVAYETGSFEYRFPPDGFHIKRPSSLKDDILELGRDNTDRKIQIKKLYEDVDGLFELDKMNKCKLDHHGEMISLLMDYFDLELIDQPAKKCLAKRKENKK